MKKIELTEREIALCVDGIHCLENEWGLNDDEQEILVKLECFLDE